MMIIRPYQPDDLDALYAISLATGFEGGDASHLYDDPRLIGHIYSAPYAVLEPELALVVEDRDGVAGFVVGVTDTSAWERSLSATGGHRSGSTMPPHPKEGWRRGAPISDAPT
jgi:hypothetical protein